MNTNWIKFFHFLCASVVEFVSFTRLTRMTIIYAMQIYCIAVRSLLKRDILHVTRGKRKKIRKIYYFNVDCQAHKYTSTKQMKDSNMKSQKKEKFFTN